MTRFIAPMILLVVTVSGAGAQGRQNTTQPAAKQKAPLSFTDRLLKFLGISSSPSTLKGPGDEVATGDIWLADLDAKTTRALTSTGGYRSPIFISGMKDVLALRGEDVIRIPFEVGEAKRLYSVEGIAKLVGCGSEDPGKALILLQGSTDGRPRVGLLTIRTGATAVMPYDASSQGDLQMVESLQGWTRTYGDQEIYVESRSKQALSGTVEWTEVFLRAGNANPVAVSLCDGTDCGQPSLSDNRRLLVFVKARE